MADNFGVYNISGEVERAVSSSVGLGSTTVNTRRLDERELYNRTLLGQALKSEIGQAQLSMSNAGMAVDGNTVALWRVDEPLSSSNLIDEVGGRIVQVFGSTVPPNVDGQIGYARFVSSSQTGLGQWLQGVGDTVLGTTFSGSGWSIESWINPSAEVAGQLIFIYNGLDFTLDPNHMILAQFGYFPTGSTGRLGFAQWVTENPGTVQNGFSTGTISSGSWSHIALTRELQVGGTPNRYTFRFYINGQLDSTHTDITGQLVSTSGSGHFVGFGGYIGAAGFGTPSGGPFIGKMDEMKISNRVRTAAEILNSYQRGTGTVPQYAAIPSWTQTPGANKRHAFVINELSSSSHELGAQNTYLSGTAPLEHTSVPASASVFYSKAERFRKLTYKLSASVNLPQTPANLRGPSQIENLPRNVFTSVSGSYRNNSYHDPAVFSIEVPEYGKIRDVRAWVELVHDHRGGTGTGSNHAGNQFWAGGSGSAVTDTYMGLQGLHIALRSPNTSFRYAHPLWNDQTVITLQKRPDENVSATHSEVPELLRNSYLLWAGHAVEKDLGMVHGVATGSLPKGFVSSSVIGAGLQQPVDPAIVVDRNNQPVIVWIRTTASLDADLMIRRPYIDGGGFNFAIEKVGTTTSGRNISVQLGTNGSVPYILFGDNTNTDLRLRVSGTGGWSNDLVDTGRGFIEVTSDLALDASNKVMVLSHRAFDNVPALFVSSSTGWTSTPIGTIPTVFATPMRQCHTIRCDNSGTFHFAFVDAKADGTPGIFYGTSGSAGLSGPTLVVQTEALNDQTLSLALDPEGIPTIVWLGGSSFSGVKVYRSSSTGWNASTHVEDIVSNATGISRKSAVYDPSGNLVIDVGFRTLRGATTYVYGGVLRSGSNGMSFEMLWDRDRGPFGGNAMDLDSQGIAHFVVRNIETIFDSTGSLYHLRRNFFSGSDGKYHEYDTDIDMRTVFTDASRFRNPRHIQDSYPQQNSSIAGPSGQPTERLRDGNSYPSPLSSSIKLFNYPWFEPSFFQDAWLSGANFPWMLDPRIPPGNFRGRNFSVTSSLGSSPPPGWLSGPGGTANTNEFDTTGSQIGPADIQPIYPLLDDVFVERVVPTTGTTGLTSQLDDNSRKIIGFRPGLRGTEVHGIWKLMIGNTTDVNGTAVTGSERGGFWFRQFRLEFTIDTGQGPSFRTYAGRSRLYDRPSHVNAAVGNRRLGIVSGSSAWDAGVNFVQFNEVPEYGRNIGITDSSERTEFAVFSQLTGALVSALSSSGKLEAVESSFLSNEFGTPYLPITSGSGEVPTLDPFTVQDSADSRRIFSEILTPSTLVPRDNTLRAFLARSQTIVSTRDAILRKLTE